MEKSTVIQVGNVLLNMEHITAIIPIKNKSGEMAVEIIFAASFEGSTIARTLFNEEAEAFVQNLHNVRPV